MSGISPAQMLGILDDAIANAPRRGTALSLCVPGGTLLGIKGKPDGPDQYGRPTYGFTRRQCEHLRQIILDAARADATSARTQARETTDA